MARNKKVVVDASVVVKWFNREEYDKDALALLKDYVEGRVDLLAPYLIIYEVGNALRYNSDFGEQDVKEAIIDLMSLELDLRLLEKEDVEECVGVAFNSALTIYDSLYVALADKENIELYSADERLIIKSSRGNVRHLKEYGK